MKKGILILWGLAMLTFSGCQYNDICTEEVPDTPRLTLKFFDADAPNTLKSVTDFNVEAVGTDSLYFENPITDTIAKIPLQTGVDSTIYRLILHQGHPDEQADTLTFQYTPDKVYMSRACGFKVEFLNFEVPNFSGNDSWIKAIEIPDPNDIIDEKHADLYIYF